MAGWIDPRPNDFSTEGLRARFKSLQDWLKDPEFNEGVRLGNGTPATYDDATGTTTPPTPTEVTSDNIAIFAQDALQSDNYDGTDVATGDATAGWRIERDTGSSEFGDARIRGSVTASEFRGADVTTVLADGGFESGLDSWAVNTTLYPTGSVAQSSTLARTGTYSMRVGNTSNMTTGVSRQFAISPGDIIYASGWVRKTSFTVTPGLEYRNEVVLNIDFLEDATTYLQFNTARTVVESGQWTFIECYAACPLNLTTATLAEVTFSNAYDSGNYLYVDDVVVGHAPILEVPYMVTNEDDSHQRALVIPNQIGFDGVGDYRFGMRADEYGDRAQLKIAGPYIADNAAQIELVADYANSTETLTLVADEIRTRGNGENLTVQVHRVPHTKQVQVTGGGGTTTSDTYADLPVRVRVTNFTKHLDNTLLVCDVFAPFIYNDTTLGIYDIAVQLNNSGSNYLVYSAIYNLSGCGSVAISGVASGTYEIEVRWKRQNGVGTLVQATFGPTTLKVTETYQ